MGCSIAYLWVGVIATAYTKEMRREERVLISVLSSLATAVAVGLRHSMIRTVRFVLFLFLENFNFKN